MEPFKFRYNKAIGTDLTEVYFFQFITHYSLNHIIDDEYRCSIDSDKPIWEMVGDKLIVQATRRSENNHTMCACTVPGEERVVLTLSMYGGKLSYEIAAPNPQKADETLKILKGLFKIATVDDSDEVDVSFWTYGQDHASEMIRPILVPKWEEIRNNYHETVQAKLDYMTGENFRPGHGGKLILWHGEPGTGKTYALRALGWEWRKWCKLGYITDSEKFFAGDANYLLKVLLKKEYDYELEDYIANDKDKWRLLVVEDAGEMLSLDAKERSGQGLSRLLNSVDGLLGQGLKVMFLITTNEPLRKLHPAVSRPGRAAVEAEFSALSLEETGAWCDSQGIERIDKSLTIAQLYNELNGGEAEIIEQKASFGFV